RIAENFDVFDFELTTSELARIDALDTGDTLDPESFGIVIDEA
ncbi:diketogulonate reductase-like aldo/keto reductase, partial [Arthrobacter sp. MP_M7]|nr:diketogulonate reductase-like aldo/keto reductase [Arthrobacter sp. MP_M4]MEC5203828.1 diketogulonate reductase-like aldo/keto reductase [Arthrobacter sp. MP_M7]